LILLLLSWVLALYDFVGRCQCFGGTYSLHLQGSSDKAGKWRTYIGFEKGQLTERGQSKRRNIEKGIPTNRP
jgi:hypothetical protein